MTAPPVPDPRRAARLGRRSTAPQGKVSRADFTRAQGLGARQAATERALHAWAAALGPDPAPDPRSVREIVGPAVYAEAAREAARLARRPPVGPVDWAALGALAPEDAP